jgi:hypothetical protein
MPTPTVRPIKDFDGSRPLIALDFDGVLNKFHREHGPLGQKRFVGPRQKRVRTGHGDKYLVDWDDDTIDGLVELIALHDLELGWLTSWGPNMQHVIEQAFDGRLAGGFIVKKMPPLFRKKRPADWKFTGLRDRVAATGQSWIWVDDEAVIEASNSGVFDDGDVIAGVGGLPVTTDEHYGITTAQLRAMDVWLTALTN